MKKIIVFTLAVIMIFGVVSTPVTANEQLSESKGWHTLFKNGYTKKSKRYIVECKYYWSDLPKWQTWMPDDGIKSVKFTKYVLKLNKKNNKGRVISKKTKKYTTKTKKKDYYKTLKNFFAKIKKKNIYNNYRNMESDLLDLNIRRALIKKNNKTLFYQCIDSRTNRIYRVKLTTKYFKEMTPTVKDIINTSLTNLSGILLSSLPLDMVNTLESGKNLANNYLSSTKMFIEYGNQTMVDLVRSAKTSINEFSSAANSSDKDYKKHKEKINKKIKSGSVYLYKIYKSIKQANKEKFNIILYMMYCSWKFNCISYN